MQTTTRARTLTAKLSARFRSLPRSTSELRACSLLLASLHSEGWQISARERRSLDAGARPIPWWTYAATHWLHRALRPQHRVFEYGSGHSTLWLANHVAHLRSVEHDAAWWRTISSALPSHAQVVLAATTGDEVAASDSDPYARAIVDSGGPFDLIVVDGMCRNTCVATALAYLAPQGLLLLDDADRESLLPSHKLLADEGFGRIDFFGPKPGAGHMSTTCVFSRSFDSWARTLLPPSVSGY